MATLDFAVTSYAKTKGSGAASIPSSQVRLSGQDTITTVENVENAGGDITVAVGEVVYFLASAKMRVSFGGVAATATTGHIIPAGSLVWLEVADAGTVSAVEGT